jgi:transcription initiation factor IIE alpha subunit
MEQNQKSLESYILLEPYINELQNTVKSAIIHLGNATDNEIIQFTGMNPSTARPRRIELTRLGVIEVAGERKQSNGRKATTWRIKKW